MELPFEVYEANVLEADDNTLLKISLDLGIGLNIDEMKAVKAYFKSEGRNPTDVELQTIGQTWSEHCYHKTFKGIIKTIDGRTVDNMFKTYIASVVKELNPDWCLSVFEDNAGIVDFADGYAIAVKVETHNHPSAIEPFGGAATGIGGVIRDILGVWADPIANIDVLCFGPLDYEYSKLPPGIKHPKYLFKGVVAGIGHYGNNMGIPTVAGAICFDEGYVGNVVVYCGCIGILPKDKYIKRIRPGHSIIIAGGKTGRDGIHGVTFASAELTEESEETSRSAVQIPNPIEEEKLRRAIIKIRDEGLGSGITDLGGGGLSSATGEMANKYGCGAIVELSKVKLKDKDMKPWEIWVSESQERMFIACPPENVDKVLEIFEEEDVEAVEIGRFTNDRRLKVLYKGYVVADLSLSFLFNPPRAVRIAEVKEDLEVEVDFEMPRDLNEILLQLLKSPNIASKEAIIRTYDHEVKGMTSIKPLQGWRAGPNDAVVMKPLPSSWAGIVVSCGIKPSYGKISPYWMAASSIDEAVRNNVCVGGRRWSLLDNFTWGNPEKPDRMGSLLKAVEACYHTAKMLRAPFISGKDSLYNESPLGPVTPTLLITAIGIIPDIRKAITVDLKDPGNPIYIVGLTGRELGGSEYYKLLKIKGGIVPRVHGRAKEIFDKVIEAIDMGMIRACHDPSEGGIAVSIAEMCLASGYGAEVYISKVPLSETMRSDLVLFSESNSRFIVEVNANRESEFLELMKGVPHARIGRVIKEPSLVLRSPSGEALIDIDVNVLWKAWREALPLR
ncbi:MAG: phosphoribosylformylglycinamidine synthase subunit PurL [Nitrososphaerota archaeon]|nr:phosphoribosylformylglycinamidine synthase subunit PurL [Candidatus Nezhaarchaeota archaeon]MDW8049891.1 phosphoribosylformylglycinamidine synthase subunit PurL [Nitrososphaerota archaeon]